MDHIDDRGVWLPMRPRDAYELVRESGLEVPGSGIAEEDPRERIIKFYTEQMGVFVEAVVWRKGDHAIVRYEVKASLVGEHDLVSPESTLMLHVRHLNARHQAQATGMPRPAPPRHEEMERAKWAIGGVMFGGFFLVFVILLFLLIRGV